MKSEEFFEVEELSPDTCWLRFATVRGRNSAIDVRADLRFHGQTSWQMSQPKTVEPIAARNSSGITPRSSIVKYAIQRRASSTYGSTSASVGQASMQRVQEPQRSRGGG